MGAVASVDAGIYRDNDYRWYTSVDGTYPGEILLGGSYFLSWPMTAEMDGVYVYYTMTNWMVPGLTLTSRMQKMKLQMPETATVCVGGYDPNNPTLALYHYEIDWAKEIKKCLDNAAKEDTILRQAAIEKLVQNKVSDFYADYQSACMKGLTEGMRYKYHSKEYHYTLYYYDQAGNLVQTVPPKGCKCVERYSGSTGDCRGGSLSCT